MPEFMCELCYPKCEEVGEIVPGHWLIRANPGWMILEGNGHKGSDIWSTPTDILFRPDPDPDNRDDFDNDIALQWIDDADAAFGWDWKIHPTDGFHFCHACVKAGWNPNEHSGLLSHWLFDRIGKILKQKG